MPKHPDSSVRIRYHKELQNGARIKVVSVGGGGNNAINRMIEAGMEGVEFISANTDLQSLHTSRAQVRLQLGARLTRGLGTGANPEIGRRAALEDAEKIIEALDGADMVFITAGLGGGTGTGAAPVIAALASQMGALTIAIVTRPFAFEGKRRMIQAERGLQELLDHVDTLIVIPNEKLLAAAKNAGFFESFQIADDVLQQAIRGISDIITVPGVINRDFADVRSTMAGMGYGVMGTASRTGPGRVAEAALAAITSPLLEAGAIDGARGILINITGSSSLKLSEVHEASTIIQNAAHEDANIIFGAVLDEHLGDEVKITVIATGFHQKSSNGAKAQERVLRNVEHPASRFETPPPQVAYSEDRFLAPEPPDPEESHELIQPERAIAPVEELEIAPSTVQSSPAKNADLQIIAPVDEEFPMPLEVAAQISYVVAEAFAFNPQSIEQSAHEPAEEDFAVEPTDEVDVSPAAALNVHVVEIEPQHIDSVGTQRSESVAAALPVTDAELSLLDVLHEDVPAFAYEEDLLAHLDGPPFDLNFSSDEFDAVAEVESSRQPEIARLRQTAMAAYAAISMPEEEEEDENEVANFTKASSFAAILQNRRTILESDEIETEHRIDEEEETQEPQASEELLQPISVMETAEEIEAVETAQPEFKTEPLRSYSDPGEVPLEPQLAQEFFNSPLFISSAEPASTFADAPVSHSADLPETKRLVPDFNRKLNRDPDFWLGSEPKAGHKDPPARIPSFAAVRNPDEPLTEYDELDIPAFLRRRT